MKFGISKKINTLFISGMLLSTFSVGIPFYLNYFNEVMENVKIRLNNGVEATRTIDSFTDLEEYSIDSPEKNPKYSKIWNKLKHIQKSFQLRYVYILKFNNEGKLRFIYDTADDPYVIRVTDSNGNNHFEYTSFAPEERKNIPPMQDEGGPGDDDYFDIYDDAPAEAYTAAKSQNQILTEAYTDKWGTFISIFHPIVKDGKTYALIGVDLEVSYIKSLKRNAMILFASIISLGLLIIVIVRKIIYLSIINPLLVLSDGSTKISEGNLDHKIKINKKDEIGELANNFNQMSSNLKESFKKIKEYNEQLEEKVEERTKQLQKTLEKVQLLKNQQDGDYFLTTLIANPLMQNRSKSPETKVEFKLIQKKKFQFKNREHQLGGDICISGNLNFKGEDYTMIMNGDAMGKSMQGAGGALVLGSLLNSIIARSANKKKLEISPVEWLVETFNELQSVMESFDGSMLVSFILALVNNKTGKLHYLNSEHPFPILVRDEKAFFLNESLSCYKLGMPDNEIQRIFSTKLLADDILLLGSDGRDDIQLEKSEDGTRVINEDQNLILKVIEDSKADLNTIYKKLSEIGELTDDFSFVKLSYFPAEKKTIDKEELILTVNDLVKSKNYSEAIDLIEKELDENELHVVLLKAHCFHKLEKNLEALMLLDNYFVYLKEQKQALKLMSKIYFSLGRYEDSKEFLLKALEIDPEDIKIQENLDKLNQYMDNLN